MKISYERIPEHMRGAMKRYIEDGISPGGFGRAVLTNNFVRAHQKADHINQERLDDWVDWLMFDIPSRAWGSKEIVNNWEGLKVKEKSA